MSNSPTTPSGTKILSESPFNYHSDVSDIAATDCEDRRTHTSILLPPRQAESHLLRLPTEMRLAIYEAALLNSSDKLALLRTCWQINMEAQAVLYQRPTSFSSQAKLFAWIERSRRTNLERVRTLSLRLTDIDLSPFFEAGITQRRKRMSAWSMYQTELERLEQALISLPNLSRLTIIPPRLGRSQLLKGLYRSFLGMIPHKCQKIRQLELHDSDEILKSVPALRDVRAVTFTEPTLKSSSISSTSKSGSETAEARRDSAMAEKAEDEDLNLKREPSSATPPWRRYSRSSGRSASI